jgi:hypothetical protein
MDRAELLTAIRARHDCRNQRHMAAELGVSQAPSAGSCAMPPRRIPTGPQSLNQARGVLQTAAGLIHVLSLIPSASTAVSALAAQGQLMRHLAAGKPARALLHYEEMSGREVSVAIGWIPWPVSWPQAAA